MLSTVELEADSDDVVLGQFNYRDLNKKAIKAVTRATAKE